MISPYAKQGYIDHQTLSFDAYDKFIEDDFLDGQRLDPKTDGRPDPRPDVRENVPILGNLANDFDFNQRPRPPVLLPRPPEDHAQGLIRATAAADPSTARPAARAPRLSTSRHREDHGQVHLEQDRHHDRDPDGEGWLEDPEHSMCEDLLGSCADNHVVRRRVRARSRRSLMSMVCGLDLHREQITFDALVVESGRVVAGPGVAAGSGTVPSLVRSRRDSRAQGGPVALAVEGCTGWRYVVEEITAAGFEAHVAEPADTQAARGRKHHAKTDRTDARLLRELLPAGDLPESWIPPTDVLEWRERVRLYKSLVDQRTVWCQRIHAELYQHGVAVPEGAIRTAMTRAMLADDGCNFRRRAGNGSGSAIR